MSIIKKCLFCGTEFKTYPFKLKEGKGKLCSRKCTFLWRCEKGIHPRIGKKHSEESKKKISLSHIGLLGFWKNKKRPNLTRKDRRSEENPGINKSGYGQFMKNYKKYLIHRIVTERVLGRELSKKATIHHIDENKLNNDPNNLFYFRKSAAHTRWHQFLKRHNLDGRILESNLELYSISI